MSKKVLVVDNDPEFVSANKMVLETKGYTVDTAVNGEEGFEKAKNGKPDLILLDVMMKYDSEGLDVALKLKKDIVTKDIPVIMITGIKKPEYLPTTFGPGEDWSNLKTVIEKPVKPEELLKNVVDALN